MGNGEFTKEHTNMTKGVLVLMLLFHHVFLGDAVERYGVQTLIGNRGTMNNMVMFCKICIAGFAFLSAYGMTKSFQKDPNAGPRELAALSVRRWLKVMLSVWFVYVPALLYSGLVMGTSIPALYAVEGLGNPIRLLLRMAVDALGLAAYCGIPTINVTWWYLSYAVLLIFTMPMLYLLYRKFRYLLLPVFCLLPAVTLTVSNIVLFAELLPSAVLGIAFAYEGWFAPAKDKKARAARFALFVVLFGLCYGLAVYVNMIFGYLLAFTIPCMIFYGICSVPVLSKVLAFLGKYSMNIFLTHTFIYYYFYTDFIYSFRRDWLILLVLLGTSLGVAIVLELLKKVTGYRRLSEKCISLLSPAPIKE